MIYLKHFKTVIDYNNYKNSYEFVLPNVSSCEEDLDFIVYNPEDEESENGSGSGSGSSDNGSGSGSGSGGSGSGSGSGSSSNEPVLGENQVLCKYNVTNTNNLTNLLYKTNNFSSMIVDGIEREVAKSYTFNTPGEHTVLFTLAEGVTSISNQTFYTCSSLTSITIGNSVISIGSSVFIGCSGLTSIIVDSNNQTYDSRNNCNAIIETSTNKLIVGCKNTIIPDSVTSIGVSAFYGGSGLTSITIPDSVRAINVSAFEDCSDLTSITIPDSVTSIGNYAFRSCSGLTSIIIDLNNQIYDSRNNCNAIIETSTNKLIAGCKNTIIPDSVTSIGSAAFCDCSRLISITIPDSVTSISGSAFESCSGLTSIICNKTTAPIIQSNTFKNIKSGGTLTVPTGSTGYDIWMGTGNYYLGKYNWTKVEVLGENQVLCKYNVTSYPISTTKLLDNSSFFASMSIDGVEQSEVVSSYTFNTTGEHIILFTLKEGLTSIGNSAFEDCSELTSITIGNSVRSINERAFSSCYRLTNITMGSSIRSINYAAFSSCRALTSITIPSSVTSINQYAFLNCSELTSIICNATTAPTIQNNTFQGIKSGGTLIVTSGSSGYNTWMSTNYGYLGYYGWTKVEQ